MKKDGYALVRIEDNSDLAWWELIPSRLEVPGTSIVVFGADASWVADGYKIEPREREFTDPPDIDPTLPAPIVPISRRQMLLELMSSGIITSDEAVAAAKSGAVPALIQESFDALPIEKQPEAAITWATMSQCERTNSLILGMAAMLGLTDAEVDGMFRSALLR
ncbi:hypothetical protein BRAO375_3660081 [Bradyrhizobium sp. ORS 375]|uniref:hypothetical protein n=1 Tax=Bradyrhizobium sp. (strain ORS 375) TaxID=566679 RepID=UPI0002406F0A|nr:hypothetical protein [Bradyrhizobium sp. ORS 375]CCD94687.1 hypothetical protein BRAO375_3660081 [Bradyrhizobium sp. ORS 375]